MLSRLKPYLVFALILNIFLTLFYQIYIYRGFFNSDAAIANILAQEIIRTKSYYPPTWWYVNGDIWTFYKHTFALFFGMFNFEAYTIHTLSVLSLFGITLVLVYSYFKSLKIDTKGILIAFLISFSLYSPMYAREVFGENAYMWYFSVAIGYLYAFYTLAYSINKKAIFFAIVAILFLSLAFVAENPSRFAIYFIAPLILPIFFFYEHIDIRYNKIALLFVLSVGFGLVYRVIIDEHILMRLGAEATYLIPFEDLPTHIYDSFVGLINFYGITWGEKNALLSYEGAVAVIKLLLFPVVFLSPALYLAKNIKNLTLFEKYTIIFGYTSFGIVFGIYALTSLHVGGLYPAKENIRYIIPSVLLIFASNGLLWRFYAPRVKFFMLSWILLSYIALPLTIQKDLSDKIINSREEVITTLLEHNLTKGYAPYWHSHIFTVLSNNKVEIRPLEDANDDEEAGRWLTSRSWYDKSYVDQNSFILMPIDEIADFEKALQENDKLTKPIKTIELQDYKIYIFSKNPISK